MLSTRSHPEVVSEYIATELALGRIAEVGLVETVKKSGIHTSPFGVIPKKHKSNKWSLILDLSSPQGFSVNDGISKESSSISYTTTDYVVEAILKSGKGTLMAKLDIKQAYRNIPVYPTDRPLLGMSWDGKVYVDKTLPFVHLPGWQATIEATICNRNQVSTFSRRNRSKAILRTQFQNTGCDDGS